MKKIIATLAMLMFLCPIAIAVPTAMQSQSSIVRFGEDVVVPTGADVESVVAIGGSITVAGNVKKDVVAIGGNVNLKNTASVGGDTMAIGGKVTRAEKASINGEVVEMASLGGALGKSAKIVTIGGIIFSLLSFIGFLVLALILVALFQQQLGRVSFYIEKETGHALGWGIIALILIPVITLLLIISLVGILFIPLFVLLIAAAMVFGYVAASQLLGKRIYHAFKRGSKPMTSEVLMGLILLYLVGLVPILGWIVKLVAVITGLGAIIKTRFGNA
ncbi:MAG: hypothetical protein ABIJ26_06100 [Candidatus Margulisiibacteriota bacterium]